MKMAGLRPPFPLRGHSLPPSRTYDLTPLVSVEERVESIHAGLHGTTVAV